MREGLKTAAFVAGALALAAAAAMVQPERYTPKLLSDEGEAFYSEFRDPQAVKAIEVVDYDESTATARPLKVELRKGGWVVATNNDYPIDIGDRLVKTSAALIDLRKDRVLTDRAQDYAKYGVIDPLDEKTGALQGRGKRVTLRDAQKNVLADFIFGKPVEGKAGWRSVRVPGGKRVYAVKTDADPSARFADWVNSGIFRMGQASIRRVAIANYSINAMTGTLDQGDSVVLTHENGQWKSPAGTVREDAVRGLVSTLDNLKIVDARPKPAEMAEDLRLGQMRLSLQTAVSLRQYGFLLTQSGRIVSGNGEMAVELANGVAYQIRFGDVASTASDTAKAAAGDRYLFVTTTWDAARAGRYGDSSGAGERVSHNLNARFAGWFYTIANSDYQKLRLTKQQVLR